ncbi:hypothetical protein D3C78_1774730 [compost metagenome]
MPNTKAMTLVRAIRMPNAEAETSSVRTMSMDTPSQERSRRRTSQKARLHRISARITKLA